MFRDTISQQDKELVFFTRDLVTRHIVPRALEYDANGNDHFDGSALDILAKHNLLAPNILPEYGGRGASHVVTAMILEEIGAGCAGVAAAVAANIQTIEDGEYYYRANPQSTTSTIKNRKLEMWQLPFGELRDAIAFCTDKEHPMDPLKLEFLPSEEEASIMLPFPR